MKRITIKNKEEITKRYLKIKESKREKYVIYLYNDGEILLRKGWGFNLSKNSFYTDGALNFFESKEDDHLYGNISREERIKAVLDIWEELLNEESIREVK